ncbi:MAG: tRNA pseudouridine(38-40) synthase TruA [Bacteroidota bacterium]
MRRWFIKLSFKGTDYAGWQIQQNARTVQGELDRALSLVLRLPVNTVGCGRTDTGVHASLFFAHFDLQGQDNLPLKETDLVRSLNGILSQDIAIHNVFEVPTDLHARFSALQRTYEYKITNCKDPFLHGLVTYSHIDLDLVELNEACRVLIGKHDFTSFSRTHTQVKTNNCQITEAIWFEENGLTVFRITADRFLRGMVRAIVGTCFKNPGVHGMRSIIEAKDRSKAGAAAPPEGLFLSDIVYPFSVSHNSENK